MNLANTVLNILSIIGIIVILAIPFLVEYLMFLKDKKDKTTYLRLGIVVITLAYMIISTLFFAFTDGLFNWSENSSIPKWDTEKFLLTVKELFRSRVFFAVCVNLFLEFSLIFLIRIAGANLSKKNIRTPEGENNEFTKAQKLERKILKFLNTETFFMAGRIALIMAISLSIFYGVICTIALIFALFNINVPYSYVYEMFESGYIYPSVSLFVLWQLYYFSEGVKRTDIECPDIAEESPDAVLIPPPDIAAIDNEIKTVFASSYICDTDITETVLKNLRKEHTLLGNFTGESVSNDSRNHSAPNELYLSCIDKLATCKNNLIINGNFFSPFSAYFLRYLSLLIARGENLIFVCNSDAEINSVYDYLNMGFSQISSPYCNDNDSLCYDNPIWKISKIYGDGKFSEGASDETNILVASPSYLSSERFEKEHKAFIPMIGNIIFTDIVSTLKTYSLQLSVLNTKLSQTGDCRKISSERHLLNKIRYLCFDNIRMPDIENVLKNLLAVKFEFTDAMNFNKDTIVRCLRFDDSGNKGADEKSADFFDTYENLGTVMNMAVFCLSKGARQVLIYTDGEIPFNALSEAFREKAGQVNIKADANCIKINRYSYAPPSHTVVMIMDSGCNLPGTIRKYASSMQDNPALVLVFSKPYMLRDFYTANINRLRQDYQPEKIPIGAKSEKDIAREILIKANDGGIKKSELYYLASFVPKFTKFVKTEDANAILRGVLEVYGQPAATDADLYRTFEYSTKNIFDSQGNYVSEDIISLKRKGNLFDIVNSREMAVLVTSNEESELPVAKNRISQKYITGQNLLHNGSLYYISKIDYEKGKIYGHLTVSSYSNEVYSYLQSREYRMEITPEKTEYLFTGSHIVINSSSDNASVKDVYISAFRAPLDVVTGKYYDINPLTFTIDTDKNNYHDILKEDDGLLSRQTYRRYGQMENPAFTTESVMKDSSVSFGEKGALTLCVRICGSFGANKDKTALLAATMLNESIHTMFPSVADSVVVCPILSGSSDNETSPLITDILPKLTVYGENSDITTENDLTLLIIEDCESELGVVSVLMSAGENILDTLFSPLYEYLDWYMNSENKSKYLYFGADTEPDCFDFNSLYRLSELMVNSKRIKSFETSVPAEYETCSFCSKRCLKEDITELKDGKKICKACALTLVENNEESLKQHLDKAKSFMENTYGIELAEDFRFLFESAEKIKNELKGNPESNFGDIPASSYRDKDTIYVEQSVPSANLSELIVRELTLSWQGKNLTGDTPVLLLEGHISLVIVQYLRYLNHHSLANTRCTFYESTSNISGEGYRRIIKELLNKKEFGNNPFRYMLSLSGTTPPDTPPADAKKKITDDKGIPYIPQKTDRKTSGEPAYYYYSVLSEKEKALYDEMLKGVKEFAEEITPQGYTTEDVKKILFCVRADHPEIFWLNTISVGENLIVFHYCTTKEEADELSKRTEKAAEEYLKDITDDMSAYDVALHFHVKLIESCDYDTVALRNEPEENDGIDYLRSICGIFLNKKAVCEGYAKALQYLLQKCGIESAEVAGNAFREGSSKGEGHAWNLIKIDGEYYYTDTTWDDSSDTIQKVKNTQINFYYFCITTEELLRTRNTEYTYAPLPMCTATKANYYNHNNLIIDTYDKDKLCEFAKDAARKGNDTVTFKCTSDELYKKILNDMFAEGNDCFILTEAASKENPKIHPTSCTYRTNKNIRTFSLVFKYK